MRSQIAAEVKRKLFYLQIISFTFYITVVFDFSRPPSPVFCFPNVLQFLNRLTYKVKTLQTKNNQNKNKGMKRILKILGQLEIIRTDIEKSKFSIE